MFEFEPTFEVNTGDLNKVYTGSGVHLNRDVTISLSLLDPEFNEIATDNDLIRNPLADIVSFDILNSSGQVVFQNYKSGATSRTLTLTEVENASIFGSYAKDFGIRSIITNRLNSQKFTGEFYVYGNVPEVDTGATFIYDGGPFVSGIQDPYSIYPFPTGGNQTQTGQIKIEVGLKNSLQYVKMLKYDIYVSTEDDIVVYEDPNLNASTNPFFLYSQSVESVSESKTLIIKPIGLSYNTEYYFTVVPYSTLGSGNHIKFGPKIFTKEAADNAPSILSANQFEVGTENNIVNLSTLSGITQYQPNVNTVIDTLQTGAYNTILYTVQFKTGDPNTYVSYISSELKLVYGGSGLDTLLESPITNTGQLTYSVATGVGGIRLLQVSGAPINSTYKIYKTSL
jgi:hypothetical protein